MPRYLSDEWLRALDDAARECPVDGHITIEHVVRDGGDDGRERRYHVIVDGTRVRFVAGAAVAPTVTFHEDRVTAVAIATGELSAPAAFLSGRLSVGGDLRALTANSSAVAAVDAAVAAVSAMTTY
jgi:putative sterol carrier protein